MRRRAFLTPMAVGWLAPAFATAQQTGKLLRIGVLDPGLPLHFSAFFAGMRDLGYVEGRDIAYVQRSSAGNADLVAQGVAEIVASKVDVIVTTGPLPTRAVMKATSIIPVVFVLGDPISIGAANNLAHPDRNATGLSFQNSEVSAKRLALLVEMLPGTRRVAVLCDPNSPPISLDETVAAASALNLEAMVRKIGTSNDFESAYAAAATEGAQAMNVLASPFFNANRRRLVDLAAHYRLPAMYESDEFVRAGGLISYGAGIVDLFRHMAGYVDKIVKGAKPADLPIQQPTKIDLTINMKTAKTLGVTFPPSIVARADEIIE